jgi:predicted kinase
MAQAPLAAALAAGEPVAYDGHCWSRAQRDEFPTTAYAAGADVAFIYLDVPESIVRMRLLANRHTSQRHDVPDDLFAQAIAMMEPSSEDERVTRYDGAEPVAAWVVTLP